MKHTLHFFLITIFLLSGVNSFAENKSNVTYACPTANISYVGTPFCSSDTNTQAVTLTGTDAYLGGVFVSTSGLTLNPTTGAITPNTSTPGVYTVLYTIAADGSCPAVNVTTLVTVLPSNTVTSASSFPVLCINTYMTTITHSTTGATGIGIPTGLPTGVTASWNSNIITISGAPTVAGVFNYSIPLIGGCGSSNAAGTIIVSSNTVSTASSTPTYCLGTPGITITHTTTGATGIQSVSNLPTGVTASWAGNILTISGTSTIAGTFPYSIPLTGGCGTVNATGTITVLPGPGNPTISGGTTTCAGIPVNLTVIGNPEVVFTMTDGSNLYTYTIGSSGIIVIPVSPTITTTYTLISANLNSCSTSVSGPESATTVTVTPTPQFITQIPDITICNGETLNLASQLTSTIPGATFVWSATTSNVNMSSISGNHTNIDQIVDLINSSQNGVINIEVKPQVGSCSGASQQIVVIVKPIPAITSTVATQNTICNNEFVMLTSNSNSSATAYNWQVNSSNGVQIVGGATNGTSTTGLINVQLALINSLTAGTISFNITPVNGICIGATITTVIITVNPTPGTPNGVPTFNICSGESPNLTIAALPNVAGTIFEWEITPSANVSVDVVTTSGSSFPFTINDILTNTSNVAGSVTYSVNTKLGDCEGGTTNYVVNVLPLPDLSVFIDGEITIDGDGNVTPYVLDTGLNTFDHNFEWYLNNTLIVDANSNTYTASEEGEYSVYVTSVVTNCSNFANAIVTESIIEDVTDLVMYPNPTFDSLSFNNINKVMSVQISNQMGQTVLYKDLNTKTGTIDLSDLNVGIYNIVFETESGIVNQRIIKQ